MVLIESNVTTVDLSFNKKSETLVEENVPQCAPHDKKTNRHR
jgi:hypothetical protein